jgi:hemoglobin/transferrin/lactoferrin receptor protein
VAPTLLIALLAAPPPTQGQNADPAPRSALPPVEVIGIAYRSGRPLDDVAPTVTAISRRDIEQGLAFDLRALLRYEPGLSVENAPGRFGLGNVAIRGVEGNRVQMLVDGIRLPEGYRVGSFSSAGRNQLDLGLLRRVEILRGPGSALYGSDALAGVIAFSTIDPADVARTRDRLHATADAGYASADDSLRHGLAVAGRGEFISALIGYQRSEGSEVDNQGDDPRIGTLRTAPNPQRRVAEAWLAKLLLGEDAAARTRLTLERHRRGIDTEVLSLNPQSARTTKLDGSDLAQRERASAEVDWQPGAWIDRLRLQAYAQRALTVDDTRDLRSGTTATCLSAIGGIDCLREARFRYVQREDGGSVIADVDDADRSGRWVLGAEFARTRFDESRSGRQTLLGTGAVSTVVGGERLPTRDFPLTESERLGVFAQDELPLAGERLTLVPALRYDRFSIRPELDPLFVNGNPARSVAALDDAALSPKLGLLWRPRAGTTVSLQWASGFRAPPAADINIGLSGLPAGYAVVPNPALKSERSRGVELGLRHRGARVEASIAVFSTEYRDLIVSRAPLACPADPACVPGATGTFQSQNVARARIRGTEAAAALRIGGPWRLQMVYAGAVGDDLGRARPLNSIDPARATLGLHYEQSRLTAAAHLTHTRAKTRIDESAASYFAAPACTTVDLTAGVALAPRVRLSAGVFNVFDRKYWLWSDLRSVPNPGASVDRYSQPGRNASLLLRAEL